jgi:GntR family transcriptional repressor for pyruvate dehydrogenase complex
MRTRPTDVRRYGSPPTVSPPASGRWKRGNHPRLFDSLAGRQEIRTMARIPQGPEDIRQQTGDKAMMFKPVPSRLTSRQVVDQVLEHVRSGQLAVGERLPSEAELALRLNVGRSSVREAIRTLETLGVVEVRRGRGTYVVMDPGEMEPLPWLTAHSADLLELLEVREAVETKAAYLAALRGRDEELIARLMQTEAEFERAVNTGESVKLDILDLSFHNLIFQLSGNPYLLQVFRFANAASVDRRASFAIPGRAAQSAEEHRAIAEAVAAHDPEAARAAMERHMENVKEAVRKVTAETTGVQG